MKPRISIIVPVYKVEAYLKKCIDSILGQSFSDYELIIVDDGSPDRCGEIADEYQKADSRIRVIHKENGGAPSARNAGIEVAEGDYLYFPDSDDWLESSYIGELYKTAEDTGAELVVSGFVMEYYEKNSQQSYSVSMPEICYNNREEVRGNLHKYFNNMMMAVPWNKLYKASYIREKGLRFPNVKWDDLHFNMEVIMDIESVAICDAAGYHFLRSRPGSETKAVFKESLYKKRREQFTHILKVYEHWGVSDKEIMSVIYGYYGGRLTQCVQEAAALGGKEGIRIIKEIIKDPLTVSALDNGRIDSGLLLPLAWCMRRRFLPGCIALGRMMGFVKSHKADVYYKIKSRSVNKAKNV